MKFDIDVFLKKLTSRKFWMAVCAFVTQLILVFGGTENEAVQITSVIMAGAVVIAYIVGEGMVDASRAESELYEYVETDNLTGKHNPLYEIPMEVESTLTKDTN